MVSTRIVKVPNDDQPQGFTVPYRTLLHQLDHVPREPKPNKCKNRYGYQLAWVERLIIRLDVICYVI